MAQLTPNRREALGALAVAPALSPSTARKLAKKRLLVLGGTRFLGPPIVRAALAAGWEVTLFNRGKSAPDLFPELDLRKGDRNDLDYASLAEGEWDAVIDTSAYIPEHVRVVCEQLQGRIGSYTLVSTVSVYAEDAAPEGPIGEDAPCIELSDEDVAAAKRIQDVTGANYGGLKALCEDAARSVLGSDRVLVARPGLIVGPEDSSDRFTYWPVRIARGGEVLVPGPGTQEVQFVDVRDLGEWTFRATAAGERGTFNGVGYPTPLSFHELAAGCKATVGAGATLTLVDEDFLTEQEVGPWMELPLWIPGGGRSYSGAAAWEKGLTHRSVGETIVDTLAWFREERGEDATTSRAGLAAEKEAKVLAAWHASRQDG